MSEVVVVNRDLLVEDALRVRALPEDAEDDRVVVAHEVAPDDTPTRIQALEAGREQQVRRCECTTGEDVALRRQPDPLSRRATDTLDAGDASTAGRQPDGDGVYLDVQTLREEVGKHPRRKVVLRVHGARVAIAGA